MKAFLTDSVRPTRPRDLPPLTEVWFALDGYGVHIPGIVIKGQRVQAVGDWDGYLLGRPPFFGWFGWESVDDVHLRLTCPMPHGFGSDDQPCCHFMDCNFLHASPLPGQVVREPITPPPEPRRPRRWRRIHLKGD